MSTFARRLKSWIEGPDHFEAFSNRLRDHLESLNDEELEKLCEEAKVRSLNPVSTFGQLERIIYQLIQTHKAERKSFKGKKENRKI